MYPNQTLLSLLGAHHSSRVALDPIFTIYERHPLSLAHGSLLHQSGPHRDKRRGGDPDTPQRRAVLKQKVVLPGQPAVHPLLKRGDHLGRDLFRRAVGPVCGSVFAEAPLGRLPVSGLKGLQALELAALLALHRAHAVLDISAAPLDQRDLLAAVLYYQVRQVVRVAVAVQPLLVRVERLARHLFVGVGGRPESPAALGEAPLRLYSEFAHGDGHVGRGRGVAAGLLGRARGRGGGRDREGEEDGGPHRCLL
mmetsp:Transcript_29089/g.69274  ORF Transcript_29089/g.69274 Transcript_29089/m.69274 type:complete len:252 (+) Transcript_29089:40-795(+)